MFLSPLLEIIFPMDVFSFNNILTSPRTPQKEEKIFVAGIAKEWKKSQFRASNKTHSVMREDTGWSKNAATSFSDKR